MIPFISSRNHHARLKKILIDSRVRILFDIGANIGDYAKHIRSLGYKHKIVCIEPSYKVFEILKSNTKNDSNIFIENFGIGDKDEKRLLHISKNLESNSLLEICPEHINAAPGAAFFENEEVTIKSFEYLRNKYIVADDKIFIKIDTQGYEWKIVNNIFINI